MSNEDLRSGLEIAVIGMAGRFPGAANIEEFWENLVNGVESIQFFSHQELEDEGINDQSINADNFIKAKGALTGVEYFDAAFFGLKATESEMMDPQVRFFYQCVWQALENAGYNGMQYKGLIGVYAGATDNYQWQMLTFSQVGSEGLSLAPMIDKDYLCTGISYKLNLKGPSFTLNTACSTSLVAIHLACQGLLSGECDMAIAGGTSVSLPAKNGYHYLSGMLLSQDGHCRTFDAGASGTVFSNGVGAVVLKALDDAIKDRDHIYAIVKGSAVNNDGMRKVGFTASSAKGQAEVIRSAYSLSEVNPETIKYVEAHGTGTIHGDPIEVEALTLGFNTNKKQYCPIGSVKANVGHLAEAAGVTSFIKTVLMLQHKLIPPSINFENPNPAIQFENTPFYVNTGLVPWENDSDEYPLRAAVSSFGVGGTNAHIILEEWPGAGDRHQMTAGSGQGQSREYQLILLSAKTETALERITENLADHFKKSPHLDLADAAYTLQVGREHFPHRRIVVCADVSDAIAALSPTAGRMETFYSLRGNPPVIFMFSGQGSQYVNMGLGLYQEEPVFRQEMDRCFEIVNQLADFNIKEILYPADPVSEVSKVNSPVLNQFNRSDMSNMSNMSDQSDRSPIDQTEVTQPLLFIIEYALARLLMTWGIQPHAMIGHSIGEYVAACLAGVFSLEDALKLVTRRGQLMQQMAPGKMLSVKLPGEQLEELLAGQDEVELAAVNSSTLSVAAGPAQAIEDFARRLEEKGCQCRVLHTSHAFHSRSMEPMMEPFRETVAQIRCSEPKRPYISNVTGKLITGRDILDPGYWLTHIRQPVRFSQGLTELLNEPDALLVEVGPGNALNTFARQHKALKPGHKILNLLRHPREEVSDRAFLMGKLGQSWIYGINFDWGIFHPRETRYRAALPSYSFETTRYSKYIDQYMEYITIHSRISMAYANGRAVTGIGQPDPADWFYQPVWKPQSLWNPGDSAKMPEKAIWVLFLDSGPFGAALQQHLESQNQETIVVKKGEAYEKSSPHQYVVHPLQPGDYETLFTDILASRESLQIQSGQILHLWGITPSGTGDKGEPPTHPAPDTDPFAYFYYLVRLIQALEKAKFNLPIQLTVLSDRMQGVTGQENIQPHKSLLAGPVRVIPWEYPQIMCRSIDILQPPVGTREEKELVEQILMEAAAQKVEPMVAFRGGLRWVPGCEPIRLETTCKEEANLREQGVWLITGGLGRVGMALAKELAPTKARLILTGRRQFPEESQWQEWLGSHGTNDQTSLKIRQLQEIKELGAEIMVCRADVSSREQMLPVIQQAEERFGKINYLVHAAGIIDYSTFVPLARVTEKDCQDQFKAKIEGLLVLDELLKDHHLDLCLLTSSLVTVIGGAGYGSYTAANQFMDTFAAMRQRIRHQHWLSVNLDIWQSGSSSPELLNDKSGADALARVLAWRGGNRIIISLGNLHQRLKLLNKPEPTKTVEENDREETRTGPTQRRQRPQLPTQYVEPQTPLEKKLTEISIEFLEIETIGIHDNFFDLGTSSLDLAQLGNRFNQALKREIPITELFRYPTINVLAKYLEEGEVIDVEATLVEEEKRVQDIASGRQVLQERLNIVKNEGEGEEDE